MKIHTHLLSFTIAAAFFAQPCFAQLHSVLVRDEPPAERLAQLDVPFANSQRFQKDRVLADRPNAIESIQIQIDGPAEVTAGKSYSYFATIENPGHRAIEKLQVSLTPNTALRPASDSYPALFLARLEPRFKGRFEFKLIADRTGSVSLGFNANGILAEPANADAFAHSKNQLSGYAVQQIEVVRPKATTQLNGPSMMYIGTDANYAIKVTNTSEKPLSVTTISMEIPTGLEILILDRQAELNTRQGQITWHVQSIQPNRSEIIQFRAKAIGGGQQISRITVNVDGQSTDEATLTTNVVNRVQAETSSNLNSIHIGR